MLADYNVCGSVIRMYWDYGVRFLLWDAHTLLPQDPGWLKGSLGLSGPLTAGDLHGGR
ncbi:hypothetical protein GCM10027596_35940 [Nocardioides korecus]